MTLAKIVESLRSYLARFYWPFRPTFISISLHLLACALGIISISIILCLIPFFLFYLIVFVMQICLQLLILLI